MKGEKNFIDFVVEAQYSKDLANGFANAKTWEDLFTFFQGRGFTAITEQECKSLQTAKSNIANQVTAAVEGVVPMY